MEIHLSLVTEMRWLAVRCTDDSELVTGLQAQLKSPEFLITPLDH